MYPALKNLTFPNNDILQWTPHKGEPIVDRFPSSQWNMIFSDIYSDEELQDFESRCFGTGYVVRECSNEDLFGYVCLLVEDEGNRTVSIHGGCWSNNAWLKYATILTMLYTLLDANMKVITTCRIENTKAYRFLLSVGFTKYNSSERYHYLRLPYSKYINSSFFNRMKDTLHLSREIAQSTAAIV